MTIKRAILLLALISAPAGAQTWSGSGLQTANYKSVGVTVHQNLGADAASMELTENRIQTRVELRLRLAGLRLVDSLNKNVTTWLYVNVNVIGGAFYVAVEYQRQVIFMVGNQQYLHTAPTWRSSSIGTHGREAAYVIDALDQQLTSSSTST